MNAPLYRATPSPMPEFMALIDRAYAGFGPCPPARRWSSWAPNHFLLELFHGPTLALSRNFAHAADRPADAGGGWNGPGTAGSLIGRRTSGEIPASAAIEEFKGPENVDVFILFPNGRVSEVQRRQMTTAADGKCPCPDRRR